MKSDFYLLHLLSKEHAFRRAIVYSGKNVILLFLFCLNALLATAQSPGGVSTGLRLWVKANAGPVTSGSNVTAWNDQSPGLRNLTTTSPVYQPLLVAPAEAYNFNPFVSFNGDFLRYTGNVLPAGSGASIFSVASQTGNTGYNTLWDFYSNDPTINTQGGRWLFWHGYATYHNTPLIKGKPVLVSGHWSNNMAASSLIDINGRQEPVNQAVNTNGNNYFLGAGSTGAVEAWEGGIAENIVYETPLSVPDQARVNSYLAIKYGITLDSDPASSIVNYDYVSSSGTTIWNSTVNASYHHDITGIGLDNASALLQLKSKSINDGFVVTIESAAISVSGSFLIIGDNAGVRSLATPYSPNSFTSSIPYFHYGRIWKVQETGTVGVVTITINSTAVTHLLVHNSNNFSTGTPVEIALVNGKATVDLTDGQYFTFAGPANAPGGVIQNLACWLKADAGTSTTTPGAAVSNWSDQSGNGNTHTQSNGTSQPVFIGAGGSYLMNYQPALRFDGTNDQLLAPAYISTNAPDNNAVHIFVVSRIDANSSTAWQTTYGIIDSWVNTIWFNRTPGNYLAGNQLATARPGMFYGITSHLMPRTGGTTKVIWNGTVNTFSNLNYANTGTNYSVGGDVLAADWVKGDIQEVIVYKGAPNLDFDLTNLAKIQSYLAIKYGITLDPAGQADYILPTGTLIWTGSNHTGYQNNIFGLGRDDNSSLYQKQAFSYGDSSISIYVGRLAGLNSANDAQIAVNNSFLVLGDNNASGYTVVNYPAGKVFQNGSTTVQVNALTNRTWQAQTTTQSSWNISINTNKYRYASYVLVSSDPAFPDASTRIYPVINGTANDVVVNNNEYIRLAAFVKGPGGVVNNLALWVKANAGVTGSSKVEKWLDQSIGGKDMMQADATYMPTVTSGLGVTNFNPVLTFSGQALYRNQDIVPFNANSSTSIFSAARPTTITGVHTLWDVYSNSPTLNALASKWNFWNLGGVHSIDPVAGLMQIANAHWQLGASGNIVREVNGLLETTAGSPITPASSQYLIGAGTTTNAEPWMGDIAENIVYNTKITGSELIKINTYLGIKYGVTLKNPLTYQYLATDGSLIWDGSNSGGFHNNVSGIGRDDMEDLNQKQSRSVNPGNQVTIGLAGIAADNNSNTALFGQDISYLVWGDNGIPNATTSVITNYGVNVTINHLNRVWRVENKGVQQSVKMSFPAALIPGALAGPCEEYKLITSNSGTLTAGAITSLQSISAEGGNYVLNYTFPAGVSYFTLGRIDPASRGIVFLPLQNSQADNFADCSTTPWKYFYEDPARARKLIAMSDFDNTYLNNLSVNISTSGFGYASAVRETYLMPRITTVADATAGTFPAAKVRIYFHPDEQMNAQIPGAISNTWIKYKGDASAIIADLQNDGLFESQKAVALTPDASGIEDGVHYVEFHNTTSFSSFIYVSSTEPLSVLLPVKLTTFNAVRVEEGIQLNWTTSQEFNNSGFAIERSTDGAGWQQIGFVPSAARGGNSQSALYYQFVDRTPLTGLNQYRLKQVDIDNRHEYSRTISIRYEDGRRLFLSPNPTNSGITIVSGLKEGDDLRLFTQTGKIIYRYRATTGQHPINLKAQPAGIYYLEVSNGNRREVMKIIRQ